jgi:hypothetical protein
VDVSGGLWISFSSTALADEMPGVAALTPARFALGNPAQAII